MALLVLMDKTVKEFIQAMKLPLELAIVKCAAHQYNNIMIPVGNNLIDTQSLIAAQNSVSDTEKKRLCVGSING